MNLIRRSKIYITRNIGSTIVLLLIMTLIGGIIYGSLQASAGLDIINAKSAEESGYTVRVEPEMDFRGTDDQEEIAVVTSEMRDQISKSEYVLKNYTSFYTSLDIIGDFEAYLPQIIPYEESDDSSGSGFVSFGGGNIAIEGVESLKADINPDNYKYNYKFTDEQISQGQNVIILNDEYMKLNDLNIGDKVDLSLSASSLTDMNGEEIEGFDDLQTVEYIIGGTYTYTPSAGEIKALTDSADDMGMDPNEQLSYYYQQAYIPTKSSIKTTDKLIAQICEITGLSESEYFGTDFEMLDYIVNYTLDYSYQLNSPKDLDAFQAEVNTITSNDTITVTEDVSYDQSLVVLESLAQMSKVIIVVSSITMIIVLSLVITLFIRGRRNEIGILISLGEKRSKIYLQIIFELITILVASLIISIPLGYFTINSVMKVDIFNLFYGGYSGFVPPEINLPFSILAAGQFTLASIVIIMISTAIPMIYLLSLKPKKILL